jgi:hypothetical protein
MMRLAQVSVTSPEEPSELETFSLASHIGKEDEKVSFCDEASDGCGRVAIDFGVWAKAESRWKRCRLFESNPRKQSLDFKETNGRIPYRLTD